VVKNASIARQTELVLDQMKAFLEAAGSDLEHCVKVIVYSRSTEKFAEINEVYRRYFPKNPPPRMFVNVAGHPADFDIEIDCTAVVRN
jgi:2-iminobutanoate/2-iminopropanoate deaminase